MSTRQFLDLDEDVSLRHSVDKYYNLNGILPVSKSQFLDLDVFLRHSVDKFYNLSGLLHWARDSSWILMKMFPYVIVWTSTITSTVYSIEHESVPRSWCFPLS